MSDPVEQRATSITYGDSEAISRRRGLGHLYIIRCGVIAAESPCPRGGEGRGGVCGGARLSLCRSGVEESAAEMITGPQRRRRRHRHRHHRFRYFHYFDMFFPARYYWL